MGESPASMRVALVVERYEATRGGVERVVSEIAAALAAAGDEVHVIARTGEATPGVRFHRVSVPTTWQPVRVLEFSRGVRRITETIPFDVVHGFARIHRQDLHHAGGGSHAAYMRAQYSPVGRALRRLSPRHIVSLALERQIASDARQRIQCISQLVRNEWADGLAVPEHRLVTIENGVDLERFHPTRHLQAREPLRHALSPGAKAVCLLPGSGFRRKGLDTALATLSRLDDPGVVLWVAGRDEPGPWRRRARRLGVADQVVFLGPRDDIERLYAACDLVLLPTRYDAGGLVALEAAASARPVLTSAACGHAELLDGAACVIQEATDVEGFTEALAGLADEGRRRVLGERGRRIAEGFGWPSVVARLRQEYRSIIDAQAAESGSVP